ncbi:MAG TPA: hypothetical protein VFG22_08670, partial [Polyangiales bacterium]|nr:hypothetical protein [Polyangiales bacterium]
MNRLKRYFPIPYLLLATLGIGLIIREMIRGPQVSLAEVGALLAIVPLVAFMSSLLMFKRARTSRNQYLMLALS